MKLQTSNFASKSSLGNTKQEMKNWAKKGRGLGHVTYFLILGWNFGFWHEDDDDLLSPVMMKL